MASTEPASEDEFFLGGDTGEVAGPITFPENLGKQAAMAVHHLADSFVRAAETGHKDVIEQAIDDRLKQQVQPLHHKRRAATRRLYTQGFRETQTQAEHIRSLLMGIARCLENPGEPVPVTVLARSVIETAALVVYAQDPALTDLDRCTRYAALLLDGYFNLNKALSEVVTSPTETPSLIALRETIDRAGMTIHYHQKRKNLPVGVSNSLTPARVETCSPIATEISEKVVGKRIFYRLFSGMTHGSAGHLLLIQDWTSTDQRPIQLGQVLVALLGLAYAVPAAYNAILTNAGVDTSPVDKHADLLIGMIQRLSDELPEEARIVIPTDRTQRI